MDLIDGIEDIANIHRLQPTQRIMDSGSESQSDLEDFSDIEQPQMANKVDELRKKLSAIQKRFEGDEEPSQPTQPTTSVLPQLNIDLSEIQTLQSTQTADTQVIQQTQTISQTVTQRIEETQDLDSDIDLDERKKAIVLQRLKDRQLAKELEKEQLQADISNVTLTDEEADELEVNHKTQGKDLKEIQKFMDLQKKQQIFDRPKTKKTFKFSTSKFLDDFDDDVPPPPVDSAEEEKIESSPHTSPIQNPIELYKSNLQSDIELEDDLMPDLTKDQLLTIRKKYVKPMKPTKNSTKQLFLKLFSLNVNQLNNTIIKDDKHIEEEENEEIMGSLLEREIERVQRIRKNEKLKMKAKQALLKGQDESDFEESEVPDSDIGESDVPDSDVADSDVPGSDAEEDAEEDEDEEEFKSRRKARIIDSEDEEAEFSGSFTEITEDKEIEDSFNKSLLFSNLEPFNPSQNKSIKSTQVISQELDTQITFTQVEDDTVIDDTQRIDTGDTQKIDTQVSATQKIDTQVLSLGDTQVLGDTQKIATQVSDTQKIDSKIDDDITPELVSQAKKSIASNLPQITEEEEDDEEDIQQQIKLYEDKIRRKELKLVQRRKEMEKKGYKSIIEGEAEESEDEWAGLGGDDFEGEDVANSEDEKMIDNNFKIDLNDEEIRQKFMDQYKIKDKKELEKLLDDIKNHKLIKKASGLTIELSDEEDELLVAYRRQKLAEQRKKLAENAKMMKKLKSEKSKAFFQSLDEEKSISIDEEEVQEPEDNTIKEEFIRSKLSFLNNSINDYDIEQNKENNRYDSDSDDNYQSLKMKSFTNLKRKYDDVEIETDEDEEKPVSDDELLPSRKPSVIKSFRSSTTSSFSGVTISKQYKVASGSKASITYISKKKKTKINIKGGKLMNANKNEFS